MTLFAVLGSATAGKMALYIYCVALRKNPIMVRGVRWCARRRGLGKWHGNEVQQEGGE